MTVTIVPDVRTGRVLPALAHAAEGFRVFPIIPNAKKPLIKDNLVLATTDTEQIREWWTKWPDANIGIACGAGSDLFVIDFDSEDATDSFETTFGTLPPTRWVRTPHGFHAYFSYRPGLRNKVGMIEHVDIRAEGGYVIATGSTVDGDDYVWFHNDPDQALADIPVLLVEHLTDGKQWHASTPPSPRGGQIDVDVERILDDRLGEILTSSEGNRNDTVNRAALMLGHYVGAGRIDRTRVEAALFDAALAVGLGHSEAHATIASGLEAGIAEPRYAPRARASRAKPARDPATFVAPQVRVLSDIQTANIAETRHVVRDLIIPGVTLLYADPKVGKSFLALGLAGAVALGDPALGSLSTAPGDVLYLALEDNDRRMKYRANRMFDGRTIDRMGVWTATDGQWASLDDGGGVQIDQWIQSATAPQLVIVDVLEKVRGADTGRNLYGQDYDTITYFNTIAARHDLAIMLVHHTNKTDSADHQRKASGTQGLVGATDHNIYMERVGSPDDHKARLHLTGRDLPEAVLNLNWDPLHDGWLLDTHVTDAQAEVIAALTRHGRMSAHELASYLVVRR